MRRKQRQRRRGWRRWWGYGLRLRRCRPGHHLQPAVDIDLLDRQTPLNRRRGATCKNQVAGSSVASHRHPEVGEGETIRLEIDAAVECKLADQRRSDGRRSLACRAPHRGDEVGQSACRYRQLATHLGIGSDATYAAIEIQGAALDLEFQRCEMALVGRSADDRVETERHTVHGGRTDQGEGPLERTRRRGDIDFLRGQRGARRRDDIGQRSLHDAQAAHRKVKPGTGRPRGLGSTGTGIELPVGTAYRVGFQDDGRLVEGETPHLELATQQRPPCGRCADPLHVDHLRALGTQRIGEADLTRADAWPREHRELQRPFDHQLAAGRLLDCLDNGRPVDIDIHHMGHGRNGKSQYAEYCSDRHHDPDSHFSGHGPVRTLLGSSGCPEPQPLARHQAESS